MNIAYTMSETRGGTDMLLFNVAFAVAAPVRVHRILGVAPRAVGLILMRWKARLAL